MKNRYQLSTFQILQKIEKLSLQPGDVIVCKDWEALDFLSKVHLPLAFTVPLVFAPSGLGKLNKQDLLNLLEQLEAPASPASPAFSESSRVPL